MNYIVQQFVNGKYYTVDNNSGDKPQPRLFKTELEAREFANRLVTLKQPVRVRCLHD